MPRPWRDQRRRNMFRCRPALFVALVLGASSLMATGASAKSSAKSHAAPVARYHQRIARFAANQSNNWSGYNQGTLEQGTKLFTSMSGDWTVPTATQHTKGEAEFSSTWIGIGGGCVDAGCTVTD